MSLKQKQRSLFSPTNKMRVRVRVCACPLQQNRIKKSFSATTLKTKLKNHTIMVVGVFFLFTSRSLSSLQTHQALDDDQRPKFLAMIAESAPLGLALGFEDQGRNLFRSSWILGVTFDGGNCSQESGALGIVGYSSGDRSTFGRSNNFCGGIGNGVGTHPSNAAAPAPSTHEAWGPRVLFD